MTASTLTIRIDAALKDALVKAAEDADQTVTEYVVRAVKLRMRGAAETTHIFQMREVETHVPFPFRAETLGVVTRGTPPAKPQPREKPRAKKRGQKGPLST